MEETKMHVGSSLKESKVRIILICIVPSYIIYVSKTINGCRLIHKADKKQKYYILQY